MGFLESVQSFTPRLGLNGTDRQSRSAEIDERSLRLSTELALGM